MNLLDQYVDDVATELHINEVNIKDTQLKLPSRKHQWAARIIRHKIAVSDLKQKRKQLRVDIAKKVVLESHIKLQDKAIEYVINECDEMQSLDAQIEQQEYLIEYLERVEKIYGSMHWEIKNIVEIMKLEQL